MNILKRFAADESGATAIEYGLIASIIAVGIIVGLSNLKSNLLTKFNNISSNISNGS